MALRALRIGVLIGNQLVEEKLFGEARPVTFGQSARCHLSIPVEGVPLEHVLFAHDQGKTLLRVTEAMDGRLAQGGQITTELRVGAGDQGVWTIPIERGARGRLRIGEATILFQEIAAPPVQPRPQLPASIRGTFADRIDRRLAMIIGGSLVVHLGIAAWAWASDIETTHLADAQKLVDWHETTMDITIPDEPVKPSTEPGVAAPVSPKQTPAPIVPPTHIATRPSQDPAQLADDAKRFAAILTGNEVGNGPGEMAHRQPGADLNQQIDEIRDRHLAIGDGAHVTRDPRLQINTNHTGPTFETGEVTGIQHRPEDLDDRRIVLKPIPDPRRDKTSLTIEDVLAKIKGPYMPGLQRCYKLGLVHDASLSGKVDLAFTVDDKGHVADHEANGVSSEVSGCVQKFMASWHFAIPHDKDGDPTEANFQLHLILGRAD